MTKKLLVTIPHFCAPSDSPNNAAANQTAYGSVAGSPARRIQAFQECLDQLARTFAYPAYALDNRTGLIGSAAFILPPEWDVEILICIHEENHLIDSVRLPTQANVIRVGGLPQELGFACHREMASRFQTCDLFCYLEDDIVITDPSFFGKHVWFHKLVNDEAIVQPNRFEVYGDWRKVYVDGPLPKRHVMRYADLKVQPELSAEYGSRRIRFMRPSNPMSACFCLNQNQLRKWVDSDVFDDRDSSYGSPLESAQILGMLKLFRVYKPSFANASFLEVEHCDSRLTRAPTPRRVLDQAIKEFG